MMCEARKKVLFFLSAYSLPLNKTTFQAETPGNKEHPVALEAHSSPYNLPMFNNP